MNNTIDTFIAATHMHKHMHNDLQRRLSALIDVIEGRTTNPNLPQGVEALYQARECTVKAEDWGGRIPLPLSRVLRELICRQRDSEDKWIENATLVSWLNDTKTEVRDALVMSTNVITEGMS